MWRHLRINTSRFYEVRENEDRFDLYFKKKKGMKFKKRFDTKYNAEEFAILYLRHCCLACQQRGLVYKVKRLGHIAGGRSSNRKSTQNHAVFCPECHTEHGIMSAVELYADIQR